ncbi:hypothetical protein BYT27DRAFT_7268131 [Phlegmacium glaucopus]|nr:hypothetical protein BYT27DRAFT_7268131 [Phlegmacium glaucopus]
MSTIESIPQPPAPLTDVNPAPASGQANGASPAPLPPTAIEGFDRWVKGFQKYESVLGEMAKASADTKFKDELATIEHWFKVLTESERTTALYTLLQHSNQDQLQFLLTVIQKKIQPPEVPKLTTISSLASQDGPTKSRLGKLILRPPSLNIAEPGSPTTPTPNTSTNPGDFVGLPPSDDANQETNPANASIPGLAGINPYTLNMLANAGLSNEAQLLAAQLVMSGLVKPSGILQQPLPRTKKPLPLTNWRTPTSARYPTSALRSSGLRPPPSALKSAGLKSSGLDSAPFMDSPREEDFDPEMLKDIPAWLRGLRLHKYTQCFEGMTWEAMVVLDGDALEAKGVAALGARRRLLRTFEHVRKRMGLEEPNSATPTTTVMPTPAVTVKPAVEHEKVPHSAFPRSKLSINSPIFTPTWETKVPHSASPAIVATLVPEASVTPAAPAPAEPTEPAEPAAPTTLPAPTETPAAVEKSAAPITPAAAAPNVIDDLSS